MSPTDYVVGAALFALMLAGTFGGAWLLLRRRLSQLTGAPKVVGYAMLATLGVLAVHLVPLALGVMDRATVIAATVVWLAAAWRTPGVVAEPDPAPEADRPSGPLAWTLAGVALVALLFVALVILTDRLTVAPVGVDFLNFHMPGVAAWLQTGSLWQIDVYLSDVAPGHYPNNADVLMLAVVLPWKSDFLTYPLMFPFWALVGVSVYALASELRVARATAAMTAALVMAIPAVSITALGGGLVDTVMVFGFSTGLLFLVRHHRNGHSSELVLAGLALGLAFGTKWYAVSAVPTVVVLWVLGRLWARRRAGELLRQTAALTSLVLAGGGVWLVRNLVESGNPFFPVKVSALGATIFDAPLDRVRARAGFTIADYFDQPDVWTEYILPQYRDSIAAPAAVVLVGALLSIVAVAMARRRPESAPAIGPIMVGIALAAVLVLAYVVTPYTAGGAEGAPVLVGADARYLVPALVVAAVLTAWTVSRFEHGPAAFAVAGLLAVLEGLSQLDQGLDLTDEGVNVGAALLLMLLAAAVALAVGPALAGRGGRARAQALAVLGAILLIAVAGLGRGVEQDYLSKRYFGSDPVAGALSTKARTGNRVGLAGVWPDDALAPPLPAFGPRLGNHVGYVGRSDKDVLRRFRTGAGFSRELARGRYNWLVVGRGRPPKPLVDEERWAVAAGFRVVTRSERLTLFRKTS